METPVSTFTIFNGKVDGTFRKQTRPLGARLDPQPSSNDSTHCSPLSFRNRRHRHTKSERSSLGPQTPNLVGILSKASPHVPICPELCARSLLNHVHLRNAFLPIHTSHRARNAKDGLANRCSLREEISKKALPSRGTKAVTVTTTMTTRPNGREALGNISLVGER